MGRNRELTNAQRKVICLHKDATSITNRELSQWATEKFSFSVSEMTISRTLKRSGQWISDKAMPDGKRARKLVCPEVEEATYAWFLAMQDKGAPLTDALVCEAAKRFYAGLDRDSAAKQLVFSHGWLGRFKKRHGIKGYVRHDEIVIADTSQELLYQIDAVQSVTAGFEPGDIFSLEETRLLFALEPNKTLATNRISSERIAKERVTVGFTVNMDGSIKLPPLVISKYTRPWAFISRNILNPANLGVLWHANCLAWMSIPIFEKYLLDFENRMLLAGKKRVLLLVDREHTHKLANVEKDLRITVVKFLPNSSGLHQSADAGIVSFIKASYRKHLLKHQMDSLLSGKNLKLDVYNAVVFLERSWRVHVTPAIISNGWRHISLCKKRPRVLLLENLNSSPQAGGWSVRLSFELNEQLTQISALLEQLRECTVGSTLLPDMTAHEYVHYEEQNGLATCNEPSEDKILENSLITEGEEDEGEEVEGANADAPVDRVPPVTYSTLQDSLHNIRTYLLQQHDDIAYMLQNLQSLETDLAGHHSRVGRQRDIAQLFVTDD